MGLQKKRWVLRAPRQDEELIRQVPCLFQVSLYRMNEPDSPQHREELSGFADPLAQLPRPRIDLPRPLPTQGLLEPSQPALAWSVSPTPAWRAQGFPAECRASPRRR